MAGSGVKVVVAAISGNSFITVIKFIGWFFSRSPSLLAEAIHSLADTLNQILLLIGLKQSEKDASRDHPVGVGEARYLWNLISAVGIFFLGFGVTAYHGLHALISPHAEVGPVSWLGIGVLVVSFIIEFYVFLQALKEVKAQKGQRSYLEFIRQSDDPTIIAVLLEDGVAVLGVLLALTGIILGQVFGSVLFDIAASLGIALLLGLMAVLLAFVNGKLLIGKSVAIHQEEEIRTFIMGLKEIETIEKMHTQILGAGQIRLSLEVDLYGEALIDPRILSEDAKKINAGESAIKILQKSSERMVRLTAHQINLLEAEIQQKFPEITIVDFEIK